MQPIFSIDEMIRTDTNAIASGISGETLMENAGRAVVEEITRRWQNKKTVILCGPGNNGGDGYVIARLLSDLNWPIKILSTIDPSKLIGDAKKAASKWNGEVDLIYDIKKYPKSELLIDCLYGTGLSRTIETKIKKLIKHYNSSKSKIISVDIPSGIHGDTGQVLGAAICADLTVTFCVPKRGHFLLPGKTLCGTIIITDIGIPKNIINDIDTNVRLNLPKNWKAHLPKPKPETHKYSRGHTFVLGGSVYSTGASRLGAEAALRIGSGAVTILAESKSLDIYAYHTTSIMLKKVSQLESILSYKKHPKSILIGPGCGVDYHTEEYLKKILKSKTPCVIDADALTLIANKPNSFIPQLHPNCVLTPHEGEFKRLFDLSSDKITSTQISSKMTGSVIVFKGADTVICSPSGRVCIDNNSTPWLSTAGSGDVLAGLISGLLSQGMDPFDAACAGVWIHGELGTRLGPGLISENICTGLPKLLSDLI